ncbi:MAG: D-tyrosyl-tRNA(Tyr) deacylase [Bacteroidetes bacterium]|nr:D-tyrosyl-tRNA(Tyr) deacylase [Bacteroidota bacterium]
MRVVIQRVSSATVTIDGKIKSSIGNGLLVLVGIEEADAMEDIHWLSQKIINLRIFPDAAEIMPARRTESGVGNLSVKDVNGEIMCVSQFTLHASTKKGNRPSYFKAAKPEIAIPLYENFVKQLCADLGKEIHTGEFGADMKVELINDGPVTIIIDSKNRE